MAHVVTENCIECKYTECVEVCPVDCFYEGENFLVIHPDECIDCAYCVTECPANAIVHQDELASSSELQCLDINLIQAEVWPNITKSKEPLAGAEQMNGAASKLELLKYSSYS